MPRILFTSQPKLPRDMQHLGYRQGMEVDVTEDQANRWLRRGCAEIVVAAVLPPAPAVVSAPVPVHEIEPFKPQVVIPDDWEDLHHMVRISLARSLSDLPVPNSEIANAVITAEIDRRTKPD